MSTNIIGTILSRATGGGGGAGSSVANGVLSADATLADASGDRTAVGTSYGHRGLGDNGAKNTAKQSAGGDGFIQLVFS